MEAGTLNLTIRRGVSFGPVAITCLGTDGQPLPLAGWAAFAQMRQSPDDPVLLDFAPVIAADDAAGLVTFPVVDYATTAALQDGVYFWDLILQTAEGRRLDPSISGTVTVSTPLTQPT